MDGLFLRGDIDDGWVCVWEMRRGSLWTDELPRDLKRLLRKLIYSTCYCATMYI